MNVKAVITGFVCGKVQPNGNPITSLTIKTALLTQEQIDQIGNKLSNYVEIDFHDNAHGWKVDSQ